MTTRPLRAAGWLLVALLLPGCAFLEGLERGVPDIEGTWEDEQGVTIVVDQQGSEFLASRDLPDIGTYWVSVEGELMLFGKVRLRFVQEDESIVKLDGLIDEEATRIEWDDGTVWTRRPDEDDAEPQDDGSGAASGS